MAVIAADMLFLLSGGAVNTDPEASLGGEISSEEVSSALNGLFNTVTADEASSGSTKYRCIYLQNINGVDTLSAIKLWIQSNTSSPDTTISIGLDPAGKNGDAVTIADENSAPAGVTFSAPADAGSGLDIGDLASADFYGFWIRRTVSPGAASDAADTTQLRISGTP